jgi:hypothetical protein
MPRNGLTIGVLAAAMLLAAACASTGGPAQPVTLADNTSAQVVVRKVGRDAYRIQLRGEGAPSRAAVENWLAYEATTVTLKQKGRWFEVAGPPSSGAPKADPMGKRFSFRMENWRPSWRLRGAKSWAPWTPTQGAAPDSATAAYEASVDVVVHGDRFDGTNPLGFDVYEFNDYIRPQTVDAPR